MCKKFIIMDDFKLIQRYISSAGLRVQDVQFFRQMFWNNVAGSFYVGGNLGYNPQHTFFFGEAHIWHEIYTCAALAHKNAIRINLSTLLYGGVEYTDLDIILGVNHGLTLQGNGDYSGVQRYYRCGFNKINFSVLDLDPLATWNTEICLTGYIFVII